MGKDGTGGSGVVQGVVGPSGIDAEFGAQRHQFVVGLTALTELTGQLQSAESAGGMERNRRARRRGP